MLDIRDYGKWVRAAIEDPQYAKGGELLAGTEWITVGEIVKDMAKGAWVQLEGVTVSFNLRGLYISHW